MVRIKAYAKVNLHLQVESERPDGYHNLKTVFAKIDLHDVVYVEAQREPIIKVDVTGEYQSPSGARNIAFKAAKWYFKRYGINWGAKILIEKRIPPGGGLGGGSSDAAAVIKGFRKIFGEWDTEVIKDSAAIGADVPFFVLDTPIAFAEGIGEILTPVDVKLENPLVLIIPGIFISTKEIFELFDKNKSHKELPLLTENKIIEVIESKDWGLIQKTFYNHLEIPVFEKYPNLREIKHKLYEKGALFSLMSGSGSTIYGVFDKERELKIDNYKIIWCKFI